MNASEQKVHSDVEQFGWHVILVPDDAVGPGFAFTIGLFHNYQHPELIVFGLSQTVAHRLLNLIGEDVKSGVRLTAGDRVPNYLESLTCAFVEFPRPSYEAFLGYARWFYDGDEFPALQCVWPDATGCYPWEAGASESARSLQPIPGRVA